MVKISTKKGKIKNEGALTTRTVERIIGETIVVATPEPVAVTRAKKVTGIEKRLHELSDNINECVEAQKKRKSKIL